MNHLFTPSNEASASTTASRVVEARPDQTRPDTDISLADIYRFFHSREGHAGDGKADIDIFSRGTSG